MEGDDRLRASSQDQTLPLEVGVFAKDHYGREVGKKPKFFLKMFGAMGKSLLGYARAGGMAPDRVRQDEARLEIREAACSHQFE